MKTERRTIYIADDGSEHQTKAAAKFCDTRSKMIELFSNPHTEGFTPIDVIDILLQNGTYKFNK